MPFDIEGAKKAGASDTQIADHLASTLGFDIASARQSGASDTDIATFLSTNARPSNTETAPITGTNNKNIPLSSVPMEALKNIPGSAVENVSNIASSFIHPVKTVQGFTSMLAGGADLLRGIDTPESKITRQVGENLSNRYGGWENVKRTAATDPVGFLLDASTILSGFGGIASKSTGILGRAGEAAKVAGEAINPVSIGAKGIGAVAAPATDWLSSRITESVYKLPVKTKLGKREAMTETIKDYGVQPSKTGWIKVKDTITDLNKQASELKAYATQTGQPIPQTALVSALDDFSKSLGGADLPKTAQKIVEKYKNKFIAEGKPAYTISELDTLKASLDDALKPVYVGQMKINPGFRTSVINDAKSALRDRISQEMKRAVPGLGELDAEQSRLLQIEPKIQEAANRIHNWSAITLYDFLIAGGAFYAKSPLGGLATEAAWRIIRSPQVQQYIARGLNATSKMPISATGVGNVALGGRFLGLPSP